LAPAGISFSIFAVLSARLSFVAMTDDKSTMDTMIAVVRAAIDLFSNGRLVWLQRVQRLYRKSKSAERGNYRVKEGMLAQNSCNLRRGKAQKMAWKSTIIHLSAQFCSFTTNPLRL